MNNVVIVEAGARRGSVELKKGQLYRRREEGRVYIVADVYENGFTVKKKHNLKGYFLIGLHDGNRWVDSRQERVELSEWESIARVTIEVKP
jgi:hypothetical protein